MKIPNHLRHKPVIILEEYEAIDGKNQGGSDAKGLSLGLAQWNDRRNIEISAKVWRHTESKWSRQSEELPLHRVLDLAILICKAKKHVSQSKNQTTFGQIDEIALQGETKPITVNSENPMIADDMGELRDFFNGEPGKLLRERFDLLAEVLADLRD